MHAQSGDQAMSSRSEVPTGNCWTSNQLLQVYMLMMSLHSFRCNAISHLSLACQRLLCACNVPSFMRSKEHLNNRHILAIRTELQAFAGMFGPRDVHK